MSQCLCFSKKVPKWTVHCGHEHLAQGFTKGYLRPGRWGVDYSAGFEHKTI